MPRRAKTSVQPVHLLIIAGILAVFGIVGWLVLTKKSDGSGSSLKGGTDLSIREYLDNASALSGNTYRIEGTVRERIDHDWKSSDGQLRAVEVTEGGETALVGVLIPPALVKTLNIERDQRYRFRVNVLANGVLEAKEITKS